MVDEDPLAAGCAELGGLSVWVLFPLRDSGVADFVCHAENGTAEVSARFGFGGGFGGSILGVSRSWLWTSGLEGTVLVTLNGSFSGADDEGACSGLDDVVGDRFKFVDLEDSCDLWKEALE
ncbi:hypothetical protein GCM10017586_12880 [Microbacterium imperiale]|uniref:Uncharacterized protein n=1 Tax=Microbacterium imperiale TaxID=33884 RepID=A0A9W6M353_9MICO|nr:hypothetical protein GCM10017586_12880 [Microbacterium imperiale]